MAAATNGANKRAAETTARLCDGVLEVAGVQSRTVSHELAWRRTPYHRGDLYITFPLVIFYLAFKKNQNMIKDQKIKYDKKNKNIHSIPHMCVSMF